MQRCALAVIPGCIRVGSCCQQSTRDLNPMSGSRHVERGVSYINPVRKLIM